MKILVTGGAGYIGSHTCKAIEVYGNDYPTPDGTCVRDYIHVTDLAAAHVAAVEALLSLSPHGGERVGVRGDFPSAINLGTGRGHSVLEVIHPQLEQMIGHAWAWMGKRPSP